MRRSRPEDRFSVPPHHSRSFVGRLTASGDGRHPARPRAMDLLGGADGNSGSRGNRRDARGHRLLLAAFPPGRLCARRPARSQVSYAGGWTGPRDRSRRRRGLVTERILTGEQTPLPSIVALRHDRPGRQRLAHGGDVQRRPRIPRLLELDRPLRPFGPVHGVPVSGAHGTASARPDHGGAGRQRLVHRAGRLRPSGRQDRPHRSESATSRNSRPPPPARCHRASPLVPTETSGSRSPPSARSASSSCPSRTPATRARSASRGGRFRVEAQWRRPSDPSPSPAHAVSLTANSGYFWFFDADNVELVAKVLDACLVDGDYWFFASGLTNLEVSMTVLDGSTNIRKTYLNPQGTAFVPIQASVVRDLPLTRGSRLGRIRRRLCAPHRLAALHHLLAVLLAEPHEPSRAGRASGPASCRAP